MPVSNPDPLGTVGSLNAVILSPVHSKTYVVIGILLSLENSNNSTSPSSAD